MVDQKAMPEEFSVKVVRGTRSNKFGKIPSGRKVGKAVGNILRAGVPPPTFITDNAAPGIPSRVWKKPVPPESQIMIRSITLPMTLLATSWVFAACQQAPPEDTSSLSEDEILARAEAIHNEAVTIDTHNDILGNWGTPEIDPCTGTDMRVDLPKMEAGDLDMTFPAVYVGQGPRTPEGYQAVKEAAMEKFDAIHRVAEEMCPEKVDIAYRVEDVDRILGEGKKVYGIGIENGYAIGTDLSLVEQYYDLGTRYITLTHSGHNDIGDSSTPRGGEGEEWGGLSPFGEEVVREMNRLGIMVDLSHVSDNTARDVFALTTAPVIASHSGARALADVPRNLNDELLQMLRENGGVIQIVALGSYLKEDPPEKTAALQALREEMGLTSREARRAMTEEQMAEYGRRVEEIENQWPGADLSTFVDHIDYVVDLIGIDHVGIGTDFDGGGGIPGFNDASEALNVTVELVRRGYTDDEIKKIWGGNLLRVWREVEAAAATSGS
jgi:microsomal dipeptidase-like Zn-dependent dipeptidase